MKFQSGTRVEVMQVRRTAKGLNLAVVRVGRLVGETLAAPELEPGAGVLQPEIRSKGGRLMALLKVYPVGAQATAA